MSLALLPLIFALVAGVTMALQGSLNSALGKVIGLLEATFIVHVTGTLTLIILLFLLQLGRGDLGRWAQAPWYTYLGGLLGVLIIYAVVASIPKLGVAVATTLIIVGQVSTALAIDHFGLFGLKAVPFTWWKVFGLALLATGAKLMLN
ncbi:MAG: DMT family transporter [Bacillota bacterium]|jgi:transporter family-2 protein|nr:DMT family transporter [Bacillota bacterium]